MALTSFAGLFGGGGFMPTMQGAGGLGDFAYYALVYKFIQSEVRSIGPAIMHNFMGLAMALALALMTMWVFWQGVRIMSGQSRESMMDFVLKAARNAFIVTVATTMSFGGFTMQSSIVDNLDKAAVLLITGKDNKHASDLIETNLAAAQVMLSTIDMVEVNEDGKMELSEQKTRTMWIAGFGAIGPAVTGGALLLMYEIAMALFVGFGPLFILCLMFEQTKQMFWKWLYYGIATTFSMAVLALMTTLALKVIGVVVASFWLSALAGGVAGTNLTQGMSSLAMQQGGIGLLLTVMLISVPPIAGNFFSAALGNFFSQSQFASGAGAAAAQQQSAATGQYLPAPNPLMGTVTGGESKSSGAVVTQPLRLQDQNTDVMKGKSEVGHAIAQDASKQPLSARPQSQGSATLMSSKSTDKRQEGGQ